MRPLPLRYTHPLPMEFMPEAIARYAESHTTAEADVLQELTRYTQAHIPMPNMLSGHVQGALLTLLARLQQPQSILEIGTYTGYSAICLAQGLAPGGRLHTIDVNADLEVVALDAFEKAGVADRITLHIGNARDIIPQLEVPTFDLVFIDADKAHYAAYFDLVIDRMPKGGLLIADNVLWKGKVTEEKQDNRTRALDAYNKKVLADPRVETVLLPVRDGLNIAYKIV